MAVMGLKINSPSNDFAVKSSLGADFAKAMFGDPETEIKIRRLQSDLVNDEYYRRAQEAATALNNAKTADQEWRTGAAQSGVGPAGQYLQDAIGPEGTTEPPVAVEVASPDAVAIPAPRPIDTIIGSDRYASPVAGRPGGPIQGQPADQPDNIPPPEPDLRLSTFPRVSDLMPPDRGPELGTRPGVYPDMPAPIGAADYGPSTNEAVPFSVSDLLGVPPEIVEPPQVPFNPLQGQPNFFPDYHDSRLPSGPVQPSGDPNISRATGDNFITLQDVIDYFSPTPETTPAPVAWDPGYPVDENTLDTGPAPNWNPQGAPGTENMLDMQPVPVSPFDAGAPVDENTLDYVPEPSHPFPDVIPLPPEPPLRSSPQGVVTDIPGRAVSGPFPPRPAGPTPDYPAETPPAITPATIPGEPLQGPPMPLPITPDEATGAADVRGPEPEVGVIHDKSGKPVARMDAAGTQALAAMVIANGGDVAGALNKLAGGLGVTYGDIHDIDRLRINSMLATGNLPSTTTQITSEDKVATQHAIDVAKAAPQSLSSGYIQIGDTAYMKDPDPNAAPGTLMIAPGQTDNSGMLKGTSEYAVNYNNLLATNRKLDEGKAISPTEQRSYNASWDFFNNPETTVSQLGTGEQQALTKYKLPPDALFRRPDQLTPGPQAQQPPAAAETPGVSPAEKLAAEQPVVPGSAVQVMAVRGPNKGKTVPVKNNGGWTDPGSKPPSKTETIEGREGVPKMVTTTFGEAKTKQVTDSATQGTKHLMESIPAMAILNEYGPGGKPIPGTFQTALDDWSRTGINEAVLNKIVDPETRAYGRAVLTFINAPKRTESGAAVNPNEVADYKARFAMPSGSNDPLDYASARQNRTQYLKAARLALSSEQNPDVLRKIDEELAMNGIDVDWIAPTKGDKKQRLHANPKTGELE